MELKPGNTLNILKQILLNNRLSISLSSVLLIAAAFVEGLSIVTLLPLLELVIGSEEKSAISKAIEPYLESFGITPSLELLLFILVGTIVVKTLIATASAFQIAYVQAAIIGRYRMQLVRHLLAARWEYFSAQSSGRISNSIVTETQGAGRIYGMVCELFSNAFQAVVYFFTAIAISVTASGAAIASGIVMMLLLGTLVRRSKQASKRQTSLLASFSSELIDALQGIKPLKAMGASSRLEKLLLSKIDDLRAVFTTMMFLKRFMDAGQEIIRALALAATLYVVIGLFQNSLEMLLVISILFVRMMDVVGRFQKQWQSIVMAEVPYNQVAERMAESGNNKEAEGGTAAATLEHGIKVDNVVFSYQERKIFDGLDVEVPAHKFTCLLGPSGSGKTTLLDLLIGLLEPDSGQILVDGRNLRSLDKVSWRKAIGYVPQEVFLFHDSLMANITLGDDTISREDVEDALRKAGAWDFVSQLENGLDEVVGERGSKLSGGQRQRISIARALARKPKLLILDEATSALDQATEAEIAKQVRNLPSEVTILAITHRPSLVEYADQVVNLERGEILSSEEAMRMFSHVSVNRE